MQITLDVYEEEFLEFCVFIQLKPVLGICSVKKAYVNFTVAELDLTIYFHKTSLSLKLEPFTNAATPLELFLNDEFFIFGLFGVGKNWERGHH